MVNIQDLNWALAKSFGRPDTNGALVSQLVPKGPAAKAGIKTGDIILAYNATPVRNASQLKFLVGQTPPGKTVKLTVWRDKKSMELTVTLGERTAKMMAAQREEESSKDLGVTVEKVPSSVASKLGLKDGVGLLIKKLEPEGAGASMGLKEGDIILEIGGKVISSASEFNKLVAESKKKGVIRMMIQRGSATLFLADAF